MITLAAVAAGQGVDLTPLVVALIAGLTGAGGVGWLTRRSTNRKLEAEGEQLYQSALLAAEHRGQEAVATVESVRKVLEERLSTAEHELDDTKRQLALAEEKLRRIEAEAATIAAERDRIVAEAQLERDALQRRILTLEEMVADLVAQSPQRRRRTDHP